MQRHNVLLARAHCCLPRLIAFPHACSSAVHCMLRARRASSERTCSLAACCGCMNLRRGHPSSPLDVPRMACSPSIHCRHCHGTCRSLPSFSLGILGDLHLAPEQMHLFHDARDHLVAASSSQGVHHPAATFVIVHCCSCWCACARAGWVGVGVECNKRRVPSTSDEPMSCRLLTMSQCQDDGAKEGAHRLA